MEGPYFPQDTGSFWFWNLRVLLLICLHFKSVEFGNFNSFPSMKHKVASLGKFGLGMLCTVVTHKS